MLEYVEYVIPSPDLEKSILVDIDMIDTYAERLIRKHILLQYVQLDHPVLKFEEVLVGRSLDEIKNKFATIVASGYHPKIVSTALCRKVHKAVRMIIRLHDIENEVAENVIMMVDKEASSSLCEESSHIS